MGGLSGGRARLTDVLELYRRLRYPIDDGLALVHGVHDARVDALLLAHRASSAATITGWNPRGVRADSALNDAANRRLRADLLSVARVVLDVPGATSELEWIAEESFFAIGVDRETAVAIGRRYDQLAILFVEVGTAALVLPL